MGDLEETWTEKSFYDKPLTVWLGEEGFVDENSPLLDVFTAASIGCYQRVKEILSGDCSVCDKKKQQWVDSYDVCSSLWPCGYNTYAFGI